MLLLYDLEHQIQHGKMWGSVMILRGHPYPILGVSSSVSKICGTAYTCMHVMTDSNKIVHGDQTR